MVDDTRIGGEGREFPTTRWSLILSAGESPESQAAALEELLRVYWKPLYCFVRRKGLDIESAKDTVQSFLTQLLERDFLAGLDPAKGRLRSYLRTAIKNHLTSQHAARSAQKRGGGGKVWSLDYELAEQTLGAAPQDPGAAFEREWALGVMERALAGLEAEFATGKRRGSFDVMRRFFQVSEAPTYADAAAESGMTRVQFKASLHRARQRFRSLVLEEIADTLEEPEEANVEIGELLEALGR